MSAVAYPNLRARTSYHISLALSARDVRMLTMNIRHNVLSASCPEVANSWNRIRRKLDRTLPIAARKHLQFRRA